MPPLYRVLICDDDQDIVNALKIYLADPTYTLLEAHTGQEALAMVAQQEIHLILMDIMMPQLDGISAMVHIRETSNVPVILLTAKGEDNDKVLGLTVGADDYITKPFNPVEVVARVKAQLRRYLHLGTACVHTAQMLVIDGVTLDDKTKRVTADGEAISLTPKEYAILKLLMEHPGEVFAPQEIYRSVWQEAPLGNESTVAVHIRHIREKIEINPAEPRLLKVVWGQGYKIEHECQHASAAIIPTDTPTVLAHDTTPTDTAPVDTTLSTPPILTTPERSHAHES
ncbi:MAG: response regulator transcription factor [Coriobacteriales bacterium]|jgi:DNA-binding response OmpR family regulator|nr:response regulator transcription factor [Coriobacteriales bacterium]